MRKPLGLRMSVILRPLRMLSISLRQGPWQGGAEEQQPLASHAPGEHRDIVRATVEPHHQLPVNQNVTRFTHAWKQSARPAETVWHHQPADKRLCHCSHPKKWEKEVKTPAKQLITHFLKVEAKAH